MCVLVPVVPPRGTERCSGAVGLLNPAAGLMPLILGAAALLENVLAAGDVCTAGGFLSTASLEHKNNLLHKSKQRFRFFFFQKKPKKTRVCSEGHVSLMFQSCKHLHAAGGNVANTWKQSQQMDHFSWKDMQRFLLPVCYFSAVNAETIPGGDAKYFKRSHVSSQTTSGIVLMHHDAENRPLGQFILYFFVTFF